MESSLDPPEIIVTFERTVDDGDARDFVCVAVARIMNRPLLNKIRISGWSRDGDRYLGGFVNGVASPNTSEAPAADCPDVVPESS